MSLITLSLLSGAATACIRNSWTPALPHPASEASPFDLFPLNEQHQMGESELSRRLKSVERRFFCNESGDCHTSLGEALSLLPDNMREFECVPASKLTWGEEKPQHEWKCPPSFLFGSDVEGIFPSPRADEALFANRSQVAIALIDPNHLDILWKMLAPIGLCCREIDPPKENPAPLDVCQSKQPISATCKGNTGWPRDQMPQLKGTTLDNYAMDKRALGYFAEKTVLPVTKLTPTQGEMNWEAVRAILLSSIDGTFHACQEEIIVVNDGKRRWVMKGHHRFVACTVLGGKMVALEIFDKQTAVLAELLRYPFVSRASLNNVLPPRSYTPSSSNADSGPRESSRG